jgi:sigma-B regulation protein RsbU (phosphoserine phosphatase)
MAICIRRWEFTVQWDRELSLAADVQRSMLPETVPAVTGYSFWVRWEPALPVGGDLYDFQTLSTGEILVVVADVAGMGLAAAMGMASLAGMIPLALERTGPDLIRLVSELNRNITRWAARVDRFVSLVAVALDPAKHRLKVVNAASHGHAVICRSPGRIDRLCPEGQADLPLGIMDGLSYRELQVELRAGDSVIITSDGITNARNAKGEEFGALRFNEILARTDRSPAKLGEAVLANAKAFADGLGLRDDVVIVCFGRDP